MKTCKFDYDGKNHGTPHERVGTEKQDSNDREGRGRKKNEMIGTEYVKMKKQKWRESVLWL